METKTHNLLGFSLILSVLDTMSYLRAMSYSEGEEERGP